ncbi:hypothetical protein [Bradyrhizobium barranii]
MTPFGLVIVAVIVTLFVVALATPAGRVALIGRARGMVLMLVWLALLALLGTMWGAAPAKRAACHSGCFVLERTRTQ